MLKRFLAPRRPAAPPPRLPEGLRIYAVGDIHGRRDLLDRLLVLIDADDAARPAARTMLIFLGDLVDRGPDSAGVVERLRLLADERPDVRFITGNHEEVMLEALGGNTQAIRAFCRIGGRETIVSYGLDDAEYEQLDYAGIGAALQRLVPAAHREFLARFEDLIEAGDYAFVHAGIRPGMPLADQKLSDLRWIRESFLDHRGTLERMIVHGHTIRPDVEMTTHRIGIDTGAYGSGILTALRLEGEDRGVIDTR